MNNKTLKKGIFGTDLHFGKKSNSELHNQDCLSYLRWFCNHARTIPDIDYVAFLGDWNENRSALNIQTLHHSYHGAKMLNDLGLPVFFVVGNHDLYHRHTREVHSVIPFNEFSNFKIIDHPIVIEEIQDKALFCPFLFHEEYPTLAQYKDIPFWAGHFEFKGFDVSGKNTKMPTGPDPLDFDGPDQIVSGHFHRRQAAGNICYMGNTFPMDFGDAGDVDRGLMIFDHVKKEMLFENWDECPKYTKTKLSLLLEGSVVLHTDSHVKCIVDVPIEFDESTALKQSFMKKYNLRNFILEESTEIKGALVDTEAEIDWEDTKIVDIEELVEQMLNEIDTEHIDNKELIKIYKRLKT